ncbi:MAG: hypothetical protein N2Z75_06225 [Meiothermus sp.]|uniref:hypothetical protein n=1 Tax=Meiothermus sp. TaxID=1955249 RepID=UPI0025EFB568|nr:hypothetical protein [Meiothermus sp.]MCS7068226.1 hypothetical protein [Meiothermus sp.]MCX7601521.1 hypothetical protein [Meiothermus sp.]MDW8425037.1 hypothetical protein [Meiothermus sp.]
MPRLALLFILLLAGCSAATRYTINVNVLSFIPQNQRTLTIPSGSGSLLFPGANQEGLLVPLPIQLDILERGQILVIANLTNTGDSTFSGNYELRLAPENDSNVNDNSGGDFGVGAGNFSVPVGTSREITINLTLSDTQNKNALDLIRRGSFRVAIRIGASSSGGTLTLNQGRISATGRPFAVIK